MVAVIALVLVSILCLIELSSLVFILTNGTLRGRLCDLMGIRTRPSYPDNDLRCEDVCCGDGEDDDEPIDEPIEETDTPADTTTPVPLDMNSLPIDKDVVLADGRTVNIKVTEKETENFPE